ncbi:MAG: glycosyltransferase family 2 protein [Methanobacteriota archaeon]|nr:MAG: glycosyltransferase family 2 protein [Euryarchaeota archaeon]
MATRPFFSILLPTKNRAHLVGYAIRSVLNQDFGDFELIIADNDDTDVTSKVVSQFDDERIRYVRTGGLDMVQNWNAALSEARGEYVLLLEDKLIFYPRAFTLLYEFILKRNPRVIVWRADIVNDSEKYYRKIVPFKDEIRTTNDILWIFLHKRMDAWEMLPRGLCTALHQSVVTDAKRRFSGPFYDYLSPDLVSALKVMKVVEEIHYFNVNLNCVISTSVSNGMRIQTRKDDGKYFGGDALSRLKLSVPVKSRFIVANLIAHDIEVTLRERWKGNVESRPYYETYKRAYYASLMAEMGVTIGTAGPCYKWSEVKEILKCNGMDLIPYMEFLCNAIIFLHPLRRIAKRLLIGNSNAYNGRYYENYKALMDDLIAD